MRGNESSARFSATRAIGLMMAVIAAVISTVFYVKRIFVVDDVLIFLTRLQFISATLGLILGVIWIRSWAGRAAIVLSGFAMYSILTVKVGIH